MKNRAFLYISHKNSTSAGNLRQMPLPESDLRRKTPAALPRGFDVDEKGNQILRQLPRSTIRWGTRVRVAIRLEFSRWLKICEADS